MFKKLCELFNAIFPLKDDPKRAMQIVFEKTMDLAKHLTLTLSPNDRDQEAIAYILINCISQFFTEEIDSTLRGIGFSPQQITQKQIEENEALIIKEAFLSACDSHPLLFTLDINSHAYFIEELGNLIQAFNLDNLSESIAHVSKQTPLHDDCGKTIEQVQQILLNNGYSLFGIMNESVRERNLNLQGYNEPASRAFIGLCSIETLENLLALVEQYRVKTAIEAVMHPHFLNKLPKFSEDSEEVEFGGNTETDSSPLHRENRVANNQHFNLAQQDNSFIQSTKRAVKELLKLFAVTEADATSISLLLEDFEETAFEEIHQDFLAYILKQPDLSGFKAFQKLNQSIYFDYLQTKSANMILMNSIQFCEVFISAEFGDYDTFLSGLAERLDSLNIVYPAVLTRYLQDETDQDWLGDLDFVELLSVIDNYLSNYSLSLLTLSTFDESLLFAIVKSENIQKIQSLESEGLFELVRL